MNIQDEMQNIHHKYGVSEKANYEIEKFVEKLIEDDRAEQLILHNVSNRDAICKECQKTIIINMMNEQVYCDDCGDWASGKCDNSDCKHK